MDGLDGLEAADLLLFVGEEERPLQGLAGLTDWRLCGALTRLLKEERFEGREGDRLLTVPSGRLPVQRIFLYGVGRGQESRSVARALEVVSRAGGKDVAIAPWAPQEPVAFAEKAADAAHLAGIERLTLLSERVPSMEKALVVVESRHPWATLEEP